MTATWVTIIPEGTEDAPEVRITASGHVMVSFPGGSCDVSLIRHDRPEAWLRQAAARMLLAAVELDEATEPPKTLTQRLDALLPGGEPS